MPHSTAKHLRHPAYLTHFAWHEGAQPSSRILHVFLTCPLHFLKLALKSCFNTFLFTPNLVQGGDLKDHNYKIENVKFMYPESID